MYYICKVLEKIIEILKIRIKVLYWKIKYGKRIKIGKKIKFRKGFKIEIGKDGLLEIGNYNFFNNYCSINCLSKIKIGDKNLFGENVKMYDHNHIFNNKQIDKSKKFSTKNIKIGSNNWIGSNVCILKNGNIGNDNVISANSVINFNVENNKVVKKIENYKIEEINYIGDQL